MKGSTAAETARQSRVAAAQVCGAQWPAEASAVSRLIRCFLCNTGSTLYVATDNPAVVATAAAAASFGDVVV